MNRIKHVFTANKNLPIVAFGHLLFIVLIVFSIHFFRERILFSDTAFQFFKIVNFKQLNIEASRYGAVLPQVPVLLAMKWGLGLKGLTLLYSVSFILLYYFIFITCTHLLKNPAAGLAVVLVLILNVSQSFFHAVTETHQALVFSVLFYAILQYSDFRKSFYRYLLAFTIILLAFFTHPIVIYPLVFIIGYVAIDKKQLRSVPPYILVIFIIMLAVSKILLTDAGSYEGQFLTKLIHSPAILLDLPNLASTAFFFNRIGGLYFWTVILELVLVSYLLHRKLYLKLAWQLVIMVLFMVFSLVTFSGGDSEMLMERAFMPLSVLIVIPLLKEIMEFEKNRTAVAGLAVLVLVIASSFGRIYAQGNEFKKRTAFNLELLAKTAQFENRKFIVAKKQLDKHIITFWSNSFETLILSAITENMPTQTIYPAGETEALEKYMAEPNSVFLGVDFWLEWNIKDLNATYFDLPEASPYKYVDIETLE